MTYWQRRYDQIEQAAHDKSVAYYSALEKKYSRAQAEIDKEINAWYQRFAVNNKIDYTEACRLLNSDELDEFRWSVEDYIKAGEENDVDGRWMKELENASARHHVNRLEALKLSTTNSIEKAMGGMTDDVDKMLRDVYKSTYYKGCYEFQRGTGIGFDLAKVNDRYLDAILKKPWCADGSNFSDKIWKNKTKLVNELDNELTRMALTGDAPGESIRRISKALHTSKNNAATLVMTEQAFFTSIAQQDAFKELGVGEFEVVATLDGLTCTTCGSHDGEHRPMSEFKPGITAPPYHPNCRCTTVPYFNDEFTTAGKRAGRDEEGKTYYVPESTKYAEWKKTFVDGDKEARDRLGLITNNNKSNPRYYDFTRKDLKTVEQEISRNDYETAVIFDNGKAINCQIGNEDTVKFTKYQLKLMKGKDVTHNHPLSTPPSPEDLYLLVDYKAKSFRTCGKNGTYVLEYNEQIEKLPNFETFSYEYNKILEELNPKIVRKYFNGSNERDVIIRLGDAIWEELYKKYGVKPKFERR